MKGETKYLEDILGLSARLVSSQGIKKIHIICQGVSEHILDLSDVSPGDIPLKLTELCKTDDKLKEYLGYRSIRVEHFVNDENGAREMKIFVTPISHVYKRHEDLLKKEDHDKPRMHVAVYGAPRISFKQHLQMFLDAQRDATAHKDM